MSAPQPGSEAEALREMRDGSLIILVGSLLSTVAMTFVWVGMLGAGLALAGRPRGEALALSGLFGTALVLIVGAVIVLYGLWGKFLPGFRKLSSLRPELSTAFSLTNIGLLWGVVLIFIGALLLVVLVGIFIMVIGAVLMIIGYVGLLLFGIKMSEIEKNALYLVAGILFIVGIFLPILQFVGWILLYVALNESAKRPAAAPGPTPSLPPPI